MKKSKIRLTPESSKLISNLHPDNKKMIKSALKELQKNVHAGDDLQEELVGFKSYKIKRYRIIYRYNEDENSIDVYYVGHRTDVYEQFREILMKLS